MSRRNTELLLLIASAFRHPALCDDVHRQVPRFPLRRSPCRSACSPPSPRRISPCILAPDADPAILPIVVKALGHRHHIRDAPGPRPRHLAAHHLVCLGSAHGGNARTGQEPRRGHALQVHLWHYRHHPADAADLIGTTISGSKLWIRIAASPIQPGEFAKVFIVLFLAGYLAENRELLSISNRKILGLKIPRSPAAAAVCRGACPPAHRRLRTRPGLGRPVSTPSFC